jgi:hypothetical protein
MKYALSTLMLALAALCAANASASTFQLKPPYITAQPAYKLIPCTPGSKGYTYFYLPLSQGGGYYKKDNCTGQVTPAD